MTGRIRRLIDNLFAEMPQIEAGRAVLVTEGYKQTENLPIIMRKDELIVGSNTQKPRSCQIFTDIHTNGWRSS